jgi:hypothetical protein
LYGADRPVHVSYSETPAAQVTIMRKSNTGRLIPRTFDAQQFLSLNINKEMFYKRVYSFNQNYYHMDILDNNFLITEKKSIEKCLNSLECINMNILRYINFLNKQYYVINISHNNTINFILQHKLELTQLLGKFVLVYNENVYNINLIKKKINIINLTAVYI